MKRTLLIFFLSVAFNSLFAQQATLSAGGDVNGTSGSVSYSVGQAVYTAIDATANTLIQGVQQPNKNNAFPVTQLVLKCTNQHDKVLLQWKTETEINSSYFTVEKSGDGEKFLPIGNVVAAGNSSSLKNYSSTDKEPVNGRNYYRTKEVDRDGKYMYSNVVSTVFDKTISIVYPNPTSGNITLKVNNFSEASLSYQLVNVDGKTLKANIIKASETLIQLTHFPSGTYILNIIGQDNSISKSFKIVKNN